MQENDNVPSNKFLIIAFIAAIFSATFLALMFSPLKIYALIGSILCALASVAFLEKQKKKGRVKYFKGVLIFAYVTLGLSVAVLVGGIIYAATATPSTAVIGFTF
ncbi:MAG: hypothetical protein J6B04_02095 [Clostridia bacterium]|nr:hypothetical protein [Clostridia bacterium]